METNKIAEAAPCYVCGNGPHPATSHRYFTEAEAYAEVVRHNDDAAVINGASLRAEAGRSL